MPRQVFEEPELAHSGQHGPALHPHSHRGDVNLQVSHLEHLMSESINSAAQRIAYAYDQLPGTEGLCNISIAPNLECLNTIRFLSSGGEEHDRYAGKLF